MSTNFLSYNHEISLAPGTLLDIVKKIKVQIYSKENNKMLFLLLVQPVAAFLLSPALALSTWLAILKDGTLEKMNLVEEQVEKLGWNIHDDYRDLDILGMSWWVFIFMGSCHEHTRSAGCFHPSELLKTKKEFSADPKVCLNLFSSLEGYLNYEDIKKFKQLEQVYGLRANCDMPFLKGTGSAGDLGSTDLYE